jgi:hypothetical protein
MHTIDENAAEQIATTTQKIDYEKAEFQLLDSEVQRLNGLLDQLEQRHDENSLELGHALNAIKARMKHGEFKKYWTAAGLKKNRVDYCTRLAAGKYEPKEQDTVVLNHRHTAVANWAPKDESKCPTPFLHVGEHGYTSTNGNTIFRASHVPGSPVFEGELLIPRDKVPQLSAVETAEVSSSKTHTTISRVNPFDDEDITTNRFPRVLEADLGIKFPAERCDALLAKPKNALQVELTIEQYENIGRAMKAFGSCDGTLRLTVTSDALYYDVVAENEQTLQVRTDTLKR